MGDRQTLPRRTACHALNQDGIDQSFAKIVRQRFHFVSRASGNLPMNHESLQVGIDLSCARPVEGARWRRLETTRIAEPEPADGYLRWHGDEAARKAVYANRERLKSGIGRETMRRRGELVERSFAHILDRGGMRRAWLRRRENIRKRYLILVRRVQSRRPDARPARSGHAEGGRGGRNGPSFSPCEPRPCWSSA